MFKFNKKKKGIEKSPSKTEIRLVTSGEINKHDLIGDMPPPEELKQSFAELLNELGVPDAKKTEMLAWPDDRKWMLLSQHQDKTKEDDNKKKGGKLLDTPQYYMGVLKSSTPTSSVLRALRVSLASQGVSWITEFLELGGLDPILHSLESIDLKHKTEESEAVRAECLYALKALMNTHAGLKAVISNSRATNQLALALVSDNVEVKSVVFSLLAALCLVPPHGHSLILEGLEYVKLTMREKQRFAHVLQGMKDVETHHMRDEYLEACMRFLNSFVNTPPELDIRIRLRSEFINQSLDVLVESIKGLSPEVDNQINIFNDMMEEDHKELDDQFSEVDIRDPVDVAIKIDNAMKTSSHRAFLISIMKSLYLLMRQEGMAGHLWSIADEVLTEVVHRKYTEEGKIAGEPKSPEVGKRFKDTLASATRVEELTDENKRLRAQIALRAGTATGGGSKLNLSQDFGAAPPSPQPGLEARLKEDERRQKELEEKLLKATQDRMQLEENAKHTKERAAQLESALDSYRSQLEQTSSKLEALEAEHAHLKENPVESQLQQATEKLNALQLEYNQLKENPVVEVQQVPVDESPLKAEIEQLNNKLEALQKEHDRLKANPEVKIVKEIVHVPVPAGGGEGAEEKKGTENDNAGKDETTTEAATAPVTGGPPPPPPPAPPGPPPPPPPPGGKVPGPPPPPPGKGGPPPPPGSKAPALPNQPPAKTGPVPKVKMVQYNWKKLAPTVQAQEGAAAPSFWNNAADRTNDIKAEFGALEDLFGAKKSTPLPKAEPGSSSPGPHPHHDDGKHKAPSAVTLLDFKRVQALSILLSRLKMSNEEIRAAILSFDAHKISQEDLKNLHKNAPTAEEIEMLKSYPDDPSTLGKPEQFFLAIMDIPRLTAKLEAFLFTQKFASQVEELKPDIETLANACSQLKGSKKFAKVLELVLALGNFVNGGTFRGGFYGFKLDSLLALQEVKSPNDHKLSLLHYFGRLLREKYPDLLNYADDLTALDAAKRISLQTIASEIGTLRKELRASTQEAEESKADSPGVSKALNSSLGAITPQFESLDAKLTQVQKAFVELVTFFGDEPKTTPEEFFSIVTRFTAQLENVHKDAANEKERAEREAKRAAQAAQRAAERTTKSPTTTPTKSKALPPTPLSPQLEAAPGATNIMDNLISDLKSDTMKDTILAHRSKRITMAPPMGGMPPNPMMAAEAMNVVLRKTGGPK